MPRAALARAFGAVAAAAAAYTLAAPPVGHAWAAWLVPGLLFGAVGGLGPLAAFGCGIAFSLLMGWGVTGWAYAASLQYFAFNPILAASFTVFVWLACGGVQYGVGLAAWSVARPRTPVGLRPLVAAWLWVVVELLRAHLFTGMPWQLLGHTQHEHLQLIQIADLGGVYAVSFVLAFASVTATEAWQARVWRQGALPALRHVAPAAGLLAAVALYGARAERRWAAPSDAPAHRIGIVQGNVANAFRWKRRFFERTLLTYAGLTKRAGADSLDLLVWPENALNFYLDDEPLLRRQVGSVAARARHGLLVGGPRLGDDGHARNAAYLLDDGGRVAAVYDKRRLVPFAEYNPLPWLADDPRDGPTYVAGETAHPLAAGPLSVGTVICYEILFPRLVRDLVRGGAEVLVNLSNDAWMDGATGAAPAQHFSMIVFRAIEMRRFVVRAAATGTSGFFDPSGRLVDVVPRGVAGTTVATVTPLTVQTPYLKWGDAWVGLLAGVVLAPLGWRRFGASP